MPRTRKPLKLDYDPDAATDDVHEIERFLQRRFGGEWVGMHRGVEVDGAALFTQTDESESGYQVLTGLVLLGDVRLGDVLTADMLRQVPVSAIENTANATRQQDQFEQVKVLPRLQREADEDAETFSRRVAHYYQAWARLMPHPVAAMAAEYDLKPPTLHAWVREARLRGFLPTGRRGKREPQTPDGQTARKGAHDGHATRTR